MNGLSWFLYLADVVEKVGNLFVILAVIATLAIPFSCLFKAFADDCLSRDAEVTAERARSLICKIGPIVAVVFTLLAVLTPEKNTVYAIAASEMGEEVLSAPEATKARKALNAWLDRQLAESAPDQPKTK